MFSLIESCLFSKLFCVHYLALAHLTLASSASFTKIMQARHAFLSSECPRCSFGRAVRDKASVCLCREANLNRNFELKFI